MEKGTLTKTKATKKLPYQYTVGRRKTATARVRFYTDGKQDNGTMIVNERPIKEYFSVAEVDVIDQLLRLHTNGLEGSFTVKVEGSGKHSQAEAVRHGIARLLIQVHPDLRPLLKQNGFLTRDARRKERKKPGLKRARKSPQWSKR